MIVARAEHATFVISVGDLDIISFFRKTTQSAYPIEIIPQSKEGC